jgi:hypothetical protein
MDACWRSHQKVYALIAGNPTVRNGLVLEDDAMLFDHVQWPAFLRELDGYMTRESIDVLQLGLLDPVSIPRVEVRVRAAVARLLNFAFRRDTAPGPHWTPSGVIPAPLDVVPDTFTQGTHCYAISRSAAQALLGLNLPVVVGPDTLLEGIAREQDFFRRFKIGSVKRSFATQRSRVRGAVLDSDLEGEYLWSGRPDFRER